MSRVTLVVIDPQVDFHEGGSLAVNGALADSQRTADLIDEHGDYITDIFVTLDSHHRTHIAHGVFWKDSNGNQPEPFTIIKCSDVSDGKWTPKDNTHLEHAKFYTSELEAKGRFKLCIWPEHCLIGTPGHAVINSINDSLQEWAGRNMNTIQYIMKGTNCMVEMYSALCAEVEMANDPSTSLDFGLIERLNEADHIIVCGQALSHCVNFTTRDILKHWKRSPSRLYLLTDASSPVLGFESDAQNFIGDMQEAGVTITTSTSVMDIIHAIDVKEMESEDRQQKQQIAEEGEE